MDFLGKSGSTKDDIEFLPDLFNGVGHLQCECERNLLNSDDIDKNQCSDNLLGSGDDDEHILCKNGNDFLGSSDHTYSNESINIVSMLQLKMTVFINVKALVLGSGERIQIDNFKTVNDDKSVNDNPY